MELQVGVKAVIVKDNKLLLLKRSAPFPGQKIHKWDIPGGRINIGEPILEALAREVKEESGLAMTGTPRIIAAQDILRVKDRHVVRLTYMVEATGNIQLSDEHSDYRWLTPTELNSLEYDLYFKAILPEVIKHIS